MSFSVLIPTPLTPAMLTSCTIAEPAPGEALWVSGATYTLGQQVIRASTHRVYEAFTGMTGRAVAPELDGAYWLDVKPTKRFAALDLTIDTASTAPTTLTYVLQPGFFDAVYMDGLKGALLTITVKDAPGGIVTAYRATSLVADVPDFYDDIFGPYKLKLQALFTGLEPSDAAEITITVMGETCAIGMLVIGMHRDFLYGAEWGGVEYGATAEPRNLSIIETDKEGNVKITEGRITTDVRIQVVADQRIAEYYTQSIRDALNTPAVWVVSSLPGYGYLTVFGLGTGTTEASGPTHFKSSIFVRGIT